MPSLRATVKLLRNIPPRLLIDATIDAYDWHDSWRATSYVLSLRVVTGFCMHDGHPFDQINDLTITVEVLHPNRVLKGHTVCSRTAPNPSRW